MLLLVKSSQGESRPCSGYSEAKTNVVEPSFSSLSVQTDGLLLALQLMTLPHPEVPALLRSPVVLPRVPAAAAAGALGGGGDLASALAAALNQRNKNLGGDSDDEEDDNDEWD
ncbi:hypothetical protein FRC04_006777 [Tulasnella sp. 424]|nr:hypothetical protein FRC04_006777 [Tulasnella sp. 424]